MPAGRQDTNTKLNVHARPSRHQLPGHARTDAPPDSPTDDRKHTHYNLHVTNHLKPRPQVR